MPHTLAWDFNWIFFPCTYCKPYVSVQGRKNSLSMLVICIYLFCQEPDERAKIDSFLLAVLTECQINLLFFIALQKKKKRSLFGKTYVTYFYFLQKLRKREIFSNGMKSQLGLPGKCVGKAGVCHLAEWYRNWYLTI